MKHLMIPVLLAGSLIALYAPKTHGRARAGRHPRQRLLRCTRLEVAPSAK